ncbi:hypothetical protein IWX83_002058 [Flavobacterium sp. CG_9.1]|nr:hypothetical protein [Flavobacterium sp. CG_9.1]
MTDKYLHDTIQKLGNSTRFMDDINQFKYLNPW